MIQVMNMEVHVMVINKNDVPAHEVVFLKDGNMYIVDGKIRMTADTYIYLYLNGFDLKVYKDRFGEYSC